MATATKQAETYDGTTPLKNARHETFAHEYVIDSNGQQAAERAGYAPKKARERAYELGTNRDVAARIKYLRDERIKSSLRSSTEVLKEVEKIAFSDVTNVVSWNESGMCFVKNSEELDPEHSAAIEIVTVTEKSSGGKSDDSMVLSTKVKHYNKLKALELLGKEHGLFKEKVEHSGSVAHTIEVMNYGDEAKS